MKKQAAAVLLSITSLFVLNSMTPDSLWMAGIDQRESTGRFPANQSSTQLEKHYETSKLEDKKLVGLEGLACKQENEEADLELKVKKLVAENEAILKELSEIKDAKKKKEEKNKDQELSQDIPVAPATNHDVFNMMSQISSLMLDQQKQQQDLLNNMFNMMSQTFSIQRAPNIGIPQDGMQAMPLQYLSTDYLLANSNIGMSIPGTQGVAPMVSPYLPMATQPVQAQMMVPAVTHPMQPQLQQTQVPYQHAGFDFGYSASLGHMASPEFTRIQF